MNNVTIGGTDPRTGQPFAYYETLAGGVGASPDGPGESAIHSHMTNTLNTPIEALEYQYPFRVLEYGVRRGSGGEGQFPGGDGLVRHGGVSGRCDGLTADRTALARGVGACGRGRRRAGPQHPA